MIAPAILMAFSHLAQRETGMDGDAGDLDLDPVGREGFVLDLAGGAAVHGVGEIGAYPAQIDLVDAAADLFVRG